MKCYIWIEGLQGLVILDHVKNILGHFYEMFCKRLALLRSI